MSEDPKPATTIESKYEESKLEAKPFTDIIDEKKGIFCMKSKSQTAKERFN